ncbi:polysaccharide pyruvyl transferase family protein [Salinibacter altiplanensis]|uniref:polysaccharide pyruvyl transferase family protein n=1 Tax=Salinibacter altiplanensis TaxID=1803181 RepID=UPI000C9F6600|nr:polysaccharide pyruvyl transferase family protein [Salinibacter altiplanensis]
MKVIVQSNNTSHNLGDASMFHVAIKRISRILSDPQIQLIEKNPNYESVCGDGKIEDVDDWQIQSWALKRPLWHRIDQAIPNLVDLFSMRWPRIKDWLTEAKANVRGNEVEARNKFVQRFEKADILFVSGGGLMTDLFASAERVCNLIMLAHSRGVPVFMFGQGIGPIRSSRLRNKARRALPEVQSIALREKKFSYPLLRDLGVPDDRITVTGDDAVTLAHNERPQALGEGIGVNLRVAYYSNISADLTETVAEVLSEASATYDAPLLPVPIAYRGENSDVASIRAILKAVGKKTDGGASLTSPEEVIRKAGKCRVVVTGSYHGGVFALSQGVPVVGLANSKYYHNKFHGLAEMFGVGCTVLRTNRGDFKVALDEAIREAWSRAPEYRSQLIREAERQIDASETAYASMVEYLASSTSN